ncbi:MAG: hypothetical protein MI919_40640 [Holophagales bacterium]|nr:hypothetical protein [Holophagales bacterium]
MLDLLNRLRRPMAPLDTEQQACLGRLHDYRQELVAGAADHLPAPDLSDELLEAMVRHTTLHARPPAAWLADCGFRARPVSDFPRTEEGNVELHRELWRILYTVSLVGFFFNDSDHLDDRAFYTYLVEQALQEPTTFQPGSEMPKSWVHDLAMNTEGGPIADAKLQLTYYRDRSPWDEMVEEQIAYLEMEDEEVPEPRPRPADRDRFMP